jgi:DNA-binding GntR family transcriptional regulator
MSAQPADASTRVAAISAHLRGRILTGQLSPGDREPLVAEGLIEARRVSGYYVARDTEAFGASALPGPEPLVDSVWALRLSVQSGPLGGGLT